MDFRKITKLFVIAVVCCLGYFQDATAQEILDEITLKNRDDGTVDIEVKFLFQIQYLRSDPDSKSKFSVIYFKVLGNLPADQWRDYQTVRTPPSDKVHDSIVRDLTLTTKDLGTGPKILINFFRASDVSVSLGRNSQSLLIHIIPEPAKQKGASQPAEIITGANTTTLPVPVDVLPKEPAVKAIVPPSAAKRIHIPLGGKDGLPVFPDIDTISQIPVELPPDENLSLEDKIKRADEQAAALMVQGGNAILAGQPFLAIESFNTILRLPSNKYTQDAQLWVGIARERIGQLAKSILEYQSYLKLYPKGDYVKWVNARLDILKKSSPAIFAQLTQPVPTQAAPVIKQNTEFQAMNFGSLAMYLYTGASRITTSGGAAAGPTTQTRTDQRSVITNMNYSTRYFNNEYDNRLVLQDFYAANLLPGQENNNRLGAFFYELKDRVVNYYARIGRQSGMGGGVMGRFDGISAGYGISSNFNVNVVSGQLAEITSDAKPIFNGASIDFGILSPIGGSLYAINQTFQGINDRRAVGGNLRYFDQGKSIMGLFDYDTLIKGTNIITIQGSSNSEGKGNDYNFLLDHRRSPILDIRNAVNGTTTTISSLLQNGWTLQDLGDLAKQRTSTTNMAQFGVVRHLNEKWNAGTDVSVSNTGGLAASGTLLPDGSTGLEGFVPAIPSSGNAWMVAQRFTGNGVIRPNDISNFSLSYSKSRTNNTESFQFNNHSELQEKWALDTSLLVSFQGDTSGGKANTISPIIKTTYRIRNTLTEDTQLGLNIAHITSSAFQTTTTNLQYFFSTGFQWNF